MGLNDGLTQTSYNSQTIHAYKLSANEHLGLVSLPYGTVQNIADFMNVTEDGDGNQIKVNFVLNCHYFDMSGGTNGFLGRCQSFTYNGTTMGVGEDGYVGYDGTSTGDKPYTDLVVLHDGTIKYGDFNSWDYTDVMIGVAPAGVQLDNGESKNWYSPACGYSKITTANTQSLLIKFDDGRFGLVAVEGKLSPLTCRDWTKSVGGVHQSCYDSGGSTQCCVRNTDDSIENVVYTGRKIPTAFVAYTIVGEEIEETPTEANYTVETYLQSNGAYPSTANSSVTRTGTVGETVNVTTSDKTPSSGYAYDTSASNVISGIVKSDGSLVLKVYFKQQFIVKYQAGEYGTFTEQSTSSLDYGADTPSAPTTTGQIGYVFNGWNPEVSETVTENVTYVATWIESTDMPYTVKHWKQNVNDDGYTLANTDNLSGTTNAETSAISKTYTGFTVQSFNQSTINADGSTIVNIYYNRDTYTITFNDGVDDSVVFEDIISTVRYGASTPIPDNPTRSGFEFVGWTPTIESIVTENVIYNAQWNEIEIVPIDLAKLSYIYVVETVLTVSQKYFPNFYEYIKDKFN